MRDFFNFWRASSPHALYLFDDQCDFYNCTAVNKVTSLACAHATCAWIFAIVPQPTEKQTRTSSLRCDLEVAQLLQPVVKFYHGPRQFAMYRIHPGVIERTKQPKRIQKGRHFEWLLPDGAKVCNCSVAFEASPRRARACLREQTPMLLENLLNR